MTSTTLGVSIAAIAIAIAAIVLVAILLTSTSRIGLELGEEKPYTPQTREILLFTHVDESIEEEKAGIPPDQYAPTEIVVKEGDKIRIHFYNLEPVESQEHHTFTMRAPYEMHYDINAGEDVVIEFTAKEEGVFDYYCTYHQPTMRGQLIVLED